MPDVPEVRPQADSTRDALIAAGLHFFGHKGFAASSTREIAARAGANIAAIAYHFGGKDGLRQACAEAVVVRLGDVFAAQDAAPTVTRDAARARLEALVRTVTAFLVTGRGAEDLAAFVLREVTEAGPVMETIYAKLIAPRHRDLCRLWGLAAGVDAEAEATRLSVFAMMGQVVYFRIGRPLILRRMGWDGIGQPQAAAIADTLVRQLHAALDATERTGP